MASDVLTPRRVNASRVLGLLLMTVRVTTDAFAQTAVAGIVIDDRTEKPIKGVLVYVEHQSVFAETDDDGRFSLSVPRGQHTITASVIGYALLQTDIEVTAAPIDLTIRLSEGAGGVHRTGHGVGFAADRVRFSAWQHLAARARAREPARRRPR